jgi:hypothetical protein
MIHSSTPQPGTYIMVLAAALHQNRHAHGGKLTGADGWLIDLDESVVYLFNDDYPDYDRRMEAIRFAFDMNMYWDMPHLTLV